MSEISRRKILLGSIAAAATAVTGGVSGCSAISGTGGPPAGGPSAGTGELALPTYKAAQLPEVEPFFTSSTGGMLDVYTEAPPTFFKSVAQQPASGGKVTTFQLTWANPSTALAKNPYWKELNERLGTSFEPTFVPAPQFDSKFATMLASGDIPDLVFVNDQSPVNLQAIRDGAFADLSETLAGDNIAQWPNLAARQENVWKASLKDGRLYQVPSVVAAITHTVVMRKDLVEKTSVGTSPANADDLFTIIKEVAAMKTALGKKVYGLGRYNDIQPALEWVFKVGADWQLDASGKLVHKIETENYRELLAWMNQAWAAGYFDPNSMSANTTDAVYGDSAFWRQPVSNSVGSGGLSLAEKDQPGMKLALLQLPAFDGTDPVVVRNIPYGRSTCISAEAAKDKDRLAEILGVLDYLSAPWGSEENVFVNAGIEGRHWDFDDQFNIVGIPDQVAELGVQYVGVESGTSPYRVNNNDAAWATSFADVQEYYAKNSIVRELEGFESASETFVAKGAQLTQLIKEEEMGIVSGRTRLSDYDAFVKRWADQGGTKVREEYEAVLAENR